MVLKKENGTRVLSIINNHYYYEIRKRNTTIKKKERWSNIIFKILVVLPLALSLLCLGINLYFDSNGIAFTGLIFLFVSYIGTILQHLLVLFANWKEFIKVLSKPFGLIIHNTKVTVRYDALLYKALMYFSTQELKYISSRMKTERNTLHSKVSLLIGGIDKIGIFPGLVAILISFNQTGNNGVSSWAQPIAYVSIILYIFGFLFHNAIIRADEKIQLIDFIIDVKNSSSNELHK
ncbi:hypothetical protein SJS51_19955 [Aeromonas caviae]|uniref:hypothetical protein n=1 Tax=Aeromonas caviae TaxID=648 RepID=UPI0029DB7643|nr:hypothetical protein [Aeromonas caviae]MDX7845810.1 hypothetical protein [Aeromonas caviae]